MKKIILKIVVFVLAAFAFADTFNPPVGAHNIYNLSSPTQLASASSAAGGGIFMPGPDAIAFNPALTATEQRIQLDVGFSALVQTLANRNSGFSFQTGIMIPTKFLVFSSVVNGLLTPVDETALALGNSLNAKAGLSKEITERLSLGLSLSGGVFWGAKTDWALGADVGILYNFGELGFLRDFRLGVSVLNLGKYYNDVSLKGVKNNAITVNFPTLATTRVGIATLLVKTKPFSAGFSFDIATPCFMDLILDAGFQMSFFDTVFVSVAESMDLVEVLNGYNNFLPSVSLGVKFNFNAKNNEYLKSRSWDSSQMLTSVAWQERYDTVHAASAGLRLYLGQKDTTPPEIKMWADEEE